MRPIIVCIDDEWTILKSLGEQLKRNFGKAYDIEFAHSSEEALLLCAELTSENRDIALIISDQKMPGLAGDALLIQLHTLYPKTLKIMLTGQADADSVGNVVNRAALYRYIRKPWDEADLILTISEALRRFQQEQLLLNQNELLKEANAKLESSVSLLLATLEATADGILALDKAGKIVSLNQKFLSMFNLSNLSPKESKDRILEAVTGEIIEPDTIKFRDLMRQFSAEKTDYLRLKNGNIIAYYLQSYELAGNSVGAVLSFRDVTQAMQAAEAIQHQALHDSLTGLPNRVLFNQHFTNALNHAASEAKLIAVMFLDLDHFKDVNDTLGHAVGDLLLQAVVQRFMGCLREEDILARWGGDEFVLLLPHIRCREDADEIAERLIDVLRSEFFLQDHRLKVSVSIGMAVYPHHGLDSTTLLQQADTALYQAKNAGRNTYQCAASNAAPP
jgi:diguanylate cyclase (GGDEF)-like protein